MTRKAAIDAKGRPRTPPARWRLVLAIVALAASHAADAGTSRQPPAACPATAYCQIRPQDQVWLISTRHLGNRSCMSSAPCCPNLCYHRYDPCCGWVATCADEFFATDCPDVVTTVYVHGNRMNDAYVLDRGFKTYCGLSCGAESPPIRHVIWSWPSQPLPRRSAIIRDARVKSRRTAVQSYYLGWWLSRCHPEVRVGLVGYSYGGRIILGATHLLAGGSLCGRQLPLSTHGATVCPRVAVMAAATQANWILPGHCYGRCAEKLDRALITYNCDDPVLKRYNRLIPGSTGPALGHVGIVCGGCLGEHAWKFEQFNATYIVGRKHSFERHYQSGAIWGRVRQYALWEDVD